MSVTQRLMGSGFSALQATNVIGDFNSALTATGSTQTDALLLSAVNSEFTTVASGTGARLPASLSPGDQFTVYNGGANALLVYPPTGESIQSGAANAGFSVAANKPAMFIKRSNTAWAAVLSA